ncbi:MAG: 4Fe-4S binding protein [Deltaproteobacteria bacterium]|nr:4Fe-4S binding protein [Deltaproteobacteria bacterium]
MFIPTVDTDKCIGCGECVEVCPVEVFELCLGCESCVEVCEQEAITVEET